MIVCAAGLGFFELSGSFALSSALSSVPLDLVLLAVFPVTNATVVLLSLFVSDPVVLLANFALVVLTMCCLDSCP